MKTRIEKNQEIQDKIEKIERCEKQKKYVKLTIKILFITIISFCGIFFYTKYFSTTGLIVKETRLTNSKIPSSFNGRKLIQFSDLYYGDNTTLTNVEKLVDTINIRKPDLVIFTGNLIDPNYKMSTTEQEKLTKELQKINSNMGKYAVSGKYDDDSITSILTQSNFKILDNEYDLIYSNNNQPIIIIGMSSLIKETRDIKKAYDYFDKSIDQNSIYSISIMSETDDLDEVLTNRNIDLVLSGNSLNGQIRLPLLGGIIPQSGSKKYKNPYYEKDNTKIYISSGIGSPDLGFRLFNRPSINFFRLSSK